MCWLVVLDTQRERHAQRHIHTQERESDKRESDKSDERVTRERRETKEILGEKRM